jgi:hypothetical protein
MTPIITVFERSPDRGKGLARDMRVRWALEEVGQPYEVRLVSFAEMKAPAHRALHPFGQIPTYEGINAMSDETRSTTGAAEMKAAQALTTKVLAIGNWTAKATPETRPPVMPFEARDTLRLQLAGKIDQWFAKTDGSGAVFLMNVTDPAEARALLEQLPLGRAGMMTFQYIPMGPLWPLGLLLREPAE